MDKKAHLIGICGAGMSAVAWLLKQAGCTVSGSDAGFYPPVSDYIARLQIPCTEGYAAENIPVGVDIIVIGKNAKLVPETNPEVAAALTSHAEKVKSFPEILAELSNDRERIVVAGSYGKSTLTSIITWCLIHAGKDPGYFVGAIPKNLENSSNVGTGQYFVFEGDEYPSANWDNRSKFLHYAPNVVLLTSACHDHVNVFPTLADYHQPFKVLLQGLTERRGQLVACLDEPNAAAFFNDYTGPKASYGLSPHADWSASEVVPGEVTRFSLNHSGTSIGKLETTLLGRHNIQNIVGAAAWLIGHEVLSFEQFKRGIATFLGLDRRLDIKSTRTSVPIYEGFGSSYEKARSAIEAVRDHFKDRKLVILFEPHTFSWRNRARLNQYRDVFRDCHRVYLYQPPTQGAATHDQLTLDEIYSEAAAHHSDIRTFDKSNWRDIVRNLRPKEDVILILSSGAFDGLLQQIINEAERLYPS